MPQNLRNNLRDKEQNSAHLANLSGARNPETAFLEDLNVQIKTILSVKLGMIRT